MKYRKLRIAWSVGWVLFGLFMIVLWVASYHGILAADAQLAILKHRVVKEQFRLAKLSSTVRGDGTRQIDAQQRKIAGMQQEMAQYRSHLLLQQQPRIRQIAVYHSFLLIYAATLAAAPWTSWQFSLRTLLIATTLIAAVLGLIVAAI